MNIDEKYRAIAKEWDEIAFERFTDLMNGNDISYETILKPTILNILKDKNLTKVLDFGCGIGLLSYEISKLAKSVLGIDISKKSVDIAIKNFANDQLSFRALNILELEKSVSFTTIVSNMTLMTMPDISGIFRVVESHLNENGNFIFSIAHPAFWPIYWKYNDSKFNYNDETEIVSTFKIRSKIYQKHKTRHFHRPLQTYFNLLAESGLKLKKILELKDPTLENWYPRFLVIESLK